MIQHINFHIWFKCCKPLKYKYALSTNTLLVLNGAYLLSRLRKDKGFTRFALLKFVAYYNYHRIGEYITVLKEHGFIEERAELYRGNKTMSISSLGVKVIEELMISYQNTFDKFIDTHKIVL